jgi:CheY-like chemotaxis protein
MGRSPPAAGPVVLVVDDELLVLRVMVSALKEAGYQVQGAADGAEALTLAAELPVPPSALVTDVQMDPIDGVTLKRMMESRFPGIRVLFVGGYGNGGDLGELPGPLLMKPFSSRQLVEALAGLLAGR